MPPLVDSTDRERAVTDVATNLVVTAGAGTGKTSLMVERVLWLVLAEGTPLTELAVITFTEKAASELVERLERSLDRVLELSSTPPDLEAAAANRPDEASRVSARLGESHRAEVVQRARAALSVLERASVGTIHAFVAEILRRHARPAGIDPAFRVDSEGMAFADLFADAWRAFVDETLDAPLDPNSSSGAAWSDLLAEFTVRQIEETARELCRFGVPLSVIDGEATECQLRLARSIIADLRARLAAIEDEVATADRVRPAFLQHVAALGEILETAHRDGSMPDAQALAVLRRSVSPGSKSNLRDRDSVQKEVERVLKTARHLVDCDPALPRRFGALLEEFCREFRREYVRRGWMTFDGIIAAGRDLLLEHPDVRRAESSRFRQILIDEFQDTDPAQYDIVFALAGRGAAREIYEPALEPGMLFIVGDAKQSIYRFRGADMTAYARAVDDVCAARGDVLTLRANFRSRPGVVDPLNDLFAEVFASAPPRRRELDPPFEDLSAVREASPEPSIEIWTVGPHTVSADDRRRFEARAIAAWIAEEMRRGRPAREIAILFRALTEVNIYLRALRDSDIPYVVEGGRGFFERYEVELLLTVLRAILHPADAVALVSCLRSPIGGVPDPELARYARSTNPAFWHLDAEPDAARFPHLSRALDAFRAFAREHANGDIVELAFAALDELPLRAAMAASYGGAQRVANLEKAVLHIAELGREGTWRDDEILDRIERSDALEQQETESPLADESLDAVRVLSIHKSKGLEWPVVILPELSRAQVPPPRKSIAIARVLPKRDEGDESDRDGFAALAFSMGERRTPASVWQPLEEAEQDAAEEKRLLYVAATRAAERLVLAIGGGARLKGGGVDALRTWGYDAGAAFAGDPLRLRDGVTHRRIENPEPVPITRGEWVLPAAVKAAVTESRAASLALGSHLAAEFAAPSATVSDDSRERATDVSAEVARHVGRALHLLLERWPPGKDADWLRANVLSAVRATETAPREIERRVARLIRGILDRAPERELDRIAAIPSHLREIPLLLRDASGQRWDGAIDAVLEENDQIEILDYKTDPEADAHELAARYRPQMAVYAEGIESALGARPRESFVSLPRPRSRETARRRPANERDRRDAEEASD